MEIPDSRNFQRVESENQIIKVEKDEEEKQNEIEPKKEKEK